MTAKRISPLPGDPGGADLATLADACVRIEAGAAPVRSRSEPSGAGRGHARVKAGDLRDAPLDAAGGKPPEAQAARAGGAFPRNAVLIAMRGARAGRLGWLREAARIDADVCGLELDEAKADWKYVFYFLLYARGDLSRTPRKELDPDRIRRIKIPLSPLPEQRRIGEALWAYDELIGNCRRRIAILDSAARACYREWFIRFRFPGKAGEAAGAGLTGQGLPGPGQTPEGWKTARLGEVAEVNPAETGTRARRPLRHGDVLWPRARPERRGYALAMHPAAGAAAPAGSVVITATKVPFFFLYLAATTDEFSAFLAKHAEGSRAPVDEAVFAKARLPIPPDPLLELFSRLTSPMAEQIHALQGRIRNLERVRDLLGPRLLALRPGSEEE